jgi:hypothetical protein
MLPTALIAFELNVTPPTKLDVALLVVAIAPLLSVTPPMELEDPEGVVSTPWYSIGAVAAFAIFMRRAVTVTIPSPAVPVTLPVWVQFEYPFGDV